MSPSHVPPAPISRHNSYVYLLAGLVLYLLANPVARELLSEKATIIGDLLLVQLLLSGFKSLARSRRELLWVGSLAGLLLVLTAIKISTGNAYAGYAILGTVLVFCTYVAAVVLRDVLFGGPVNINRLWGAVCVYLLIGMTWAVLYALLDAASPAAFLSNMPEPSVTDWSGDIHAYVYYSFVTLTTLGFGDVTPITPVARTLTYLEAAFGQLYLTILVAALVGMVAGKVRSSGDDARSPD